MAKKKEERFVKVYSQGGLTTGNLTIYVDKQTGVNYLFTQAGYAGGLCVLVDREGKPIITSVPRDE